MELQGFKPPELFTSAPKCTYFPYAGDEASSSTRKSPSQQNRVNSVEAETSLIRAVSHDSKTELASQTKCLSLSADFGRASTTKLLHLCCDFDSAECAAAILGGEIGTSVPLVNECDDYGKAPLHTAASAHASRCVEVLLKKHARTDLRTKDAQPQLPLELSLTDTRMDPKCDINDISIEELVILMSRKDLRTVKLLSEKTKEIGDVAHSCAVKGRIASLTALLLVAAEKVVNECVIAVRDASSGSEEKVSLYEWLIRKALALGASAKRASSATAETEGKNLERRKVLLREIELLQLFGAVALSCGGDKKVTSLKVSPLVRAAQVGDEDIIRLLLRTKIDINGTDAEGNTALHWVLKLSRLTSPQQIKIILLLIDHGARVSQKNRLGLTAFHVAASNGDSEALEVLLLEDPFGVQYKTEMKETPLFFAVKNESKECAELLLTWGANSEVLNLRRQRAIDLATSQDMRYILLNPTTVSLINHAFPNQHKRTALELSSSVSSRTDEDSTTTSDSSHVSTVCARNSNSSTKSEVCKYFDSHRGCVRGTKCFYAHCEEESQKVKRGVDPSYSFTAKLLKHKVFIGGLPPSVDTDVLRKFCEEEFGSVEDAIVIVTQVENKVQSRGFGFVTFRQEKYALKATEAHYVTLRGKTVEIKSLIPRLVLGAEFEKMSPQREREQVFEVLEQKSYEKVMEGDKPEHGSWADRLIHGIPMVCSTEPQVTKRSEDPSTPKWLKVFKKWFPGFLKGLSNHPSYALSSLKADFRAKFGLELDHSSVGYSKLSDFLKCFSNLCTVQMLPIGTRRTNTHMIIRPKLTRPKCRFFPSLETPESLSLSALVVNGGDSTCFSDLSASDGGDSKRLQDLSNEHGGDLKCLESLSIESCSDTKSLQDLTAANAVDSKYREDLSLDFPGDSKCTEDLSIWSAGEKSSSTITSQEDENPSSGYGDVSSAEDVHGVHPRFLQFLKPDPLLYSQEQTDLLSGENENGKEHSSSSNKASTNVRDPRQHLVLESLSKKWSKSYFVRQFDYYEKYKERLSARRCFACNQQRMIWANFPCKHLLWCNDCKSRAISAAGLFPHKCVMCDTEVLKMDLVLPSTIN